MYRKRWMYNYRENYEVLEIDEDVGDYLIIDDINNKQWYLIEFFKTQSEIRIEKIDKLLNL